MLRVTDGLFDLYELHLDRYRCWNQTAYRVYTWLVVIPIALGLLAALAFTFRVARRHYRHYEEQRWQANAQAFLARGDFANAALSARKAVTLNPNNVPACRIMETLAELAHSPAALDWQRRIVENQPTLNNKLQLAVVALSCQAPPFPLTTQILKALDPAATNLASYQAVAARLALSLHRFAEAEARFETAIKLDPTNQSFALNLATLRLTSTNAAVAAQARATLEKFRSDPNLGLSALRSLVSDRLAHKDFAGANAYSTQLLANVQANLGDRLQHLAILRQLKSPEFNDALATLQQEVATNGPVAAEVANWMQANGLVAESLDWLTGLANPLLDQRPIQLALAQGYLQTSQWTKLLNTVGQSNWRDLEYLRLALIFRAWSQMGVARAADVNWNAALAQAAGHRDALAHLLQLAESWQLPKKQETVLFQMVQSFPEDRRAQTELGRMYFNSGNTLGLHDLFAVLAAKFPTNTDYQNNLAFTDLLLKMNVRQARQSAAGLYARSPTNAVLASTYAFALHLQGRDKQGLAVLEKLTPVELKQPSVALYYGILLADIGKTDQAKPWLQIAQTKSHLLPEEKNLLSAALDKVQDLRP